MDQFHDCLTACETRGHPPTETCPDCIPLLEEAVALYRDHFLAGFTLRDSLAFDEWQFFQTEELKDQLASALVRLARHYASQGDFEPAVTRGRRWLALDPLHEPAHRHLMALYAQSGQRSAALRQYETCRDLLTKELRVEPSEETVALCERIRAGELDVLPPVPTSLHAIPLQLPAFLTEGAEAKGTERPVFVARERELERLSGFLKTALAGTGQVVFVTGGAGRGKTTLVQ